MARYVMESRVMAGQESEHLDTTVADSAPFVEDENPARTQSALPAQFTDLDLIALLPDGLIVYDAEGRIVRTNPALRTLLALDRQLDYGTTPLRERAARLQLRDTWGNPLPYDQWPHVRVLRGETLARDSAAETLVTALDGRDLILRTTGAPIHDEAGNLAGAVCLTRDVTKRTSSEREAAAWARQLDAIFDAIPDGLGFFDGQGTPIRFNRAAQVLFGANRHEALDHIPDAYAVRTLAGDPIPLADLPLTQALAGTPSGPTEMLVRMADDNDQIVAVRAAPWFDPRGTLEGVVVVAHDITALRTAERDAAARASELEAIFEAIADGLYVNGADGRLLRMNAAARALVALDVVPDPAAYGAEELSRATAPRATTGQPLPREQWPLQRVLRGEVLTNDGAVDMLVRTLAGHDKYMSITGAPVRDAAGRVVRAVTVVRDVTEQRRLERQTRDALHALVAMAQTLVLTPEELDGEAPAGRAAATRVGLRLVELTRNVLGCTRVGITAFDLLAGVQHPVAVAGLTPEQERAWWASVEGAPLQDPQAPLDPSLIARFFAGESLVLDMTQPPFRDQPNPFGIRTFLTAPLRVNEGVIGSLSLDYGGLDHRYSPDEIALAGAVAQLAALTLDRDRLRREREEARARELALRETNQRMDEFLSIASHELKSPLTAMRGNIQLVGRRLERVAARGDMTADELAATVAPLKAMLERTEQQITRQARLIDDLLDVSRIQTGHLELHLEPCDPVALVRECVEEQRLAWPARTITLQIQGDHVVVQADADRIRQVVTNYLSNAFKYSAPDRPVEVSLHADRDAVMVRVRDHGPGLTAEQQSQVWDRYGRVPGVAVRDAAHAGGGLGLGLYISRMIVEQHRGQVGVESVPGEGATFWFTLPCA